MPDLCGFKYYRCTALKVSTSNLFLNVFFNCPYSVVDVERCDLNIKSNNGSHHTHLYGEDRLIVRRGKPFDVSLHLSSDSKEFKVGEASFAFIVETGTPHLFTFDFSVLRQEYLGAKWKYMWTCASTLFQASHLNRYFVFLSTYVSLQVHYPEKNLTQRFPSVHETPLWTLNGAPPSLMVPLETH